MKTTKPFTIAEYADKLAASISSAEVVFHQREIAMLLKEFADAILNARLNDPITRDYDTPAEDKAWDGL